MKFALVICFHTLWPAACPRAAPSPCCRRAGHTTPTHTTCSGHTCNRQECVSVWLLSSTSHQQVNIFTQSTCLNESRRRRREYLSFFCVQTSFNVESKADSEPFLGPFCREKKRRRMNLKFIWCFSGVRLRRALLLRRTSPRALGEGENVWGHTMWPLAEAAGPPLVQSQPPPTNPPNNPPPPKTRSSSSSSSSSDRCCT